MNTTEYFKRTIQAYLEERAMEDELFAAKYDNPDKNNYLYNNLFVGIRCGCRYNSSNRLCNSSGFTDYLTNI